MNSVIISDYGVMFAKIAERGGLRGRSLGHPRAHSFSHSAASKVASFSRLRRAK